MCDAFRLGSRLNKTIDYISILSVNKSAVWRYDVILGCDMCSCQPSNPVSKISNNLGEYPGKSLLKALPIQPLTRRRGRGHKESHELWGRLPAEQRRVHLGVSSPAPGLVASVWISAINTADHYSASTSHQTASAVMMLHYRDRIPPYIDFDISPILQMF